MGHSAKKTEHSGAKKGKGAYAGIKRDAKPQSNKVRRKVGKQLSSEIEDDILYRER